MLIKVCGMRDADNIHAVSQLGVDLIGLIFYPKSPRFVRMISSQAGIIPDYSELRLQNIREHGSIQQQIDSSKSDVHFVGVFVDEMPQNIITRIYNYNLDYVQLHGNESVFMIDNLRCTVDPDIKPGLKIIKAISIESPRILINTRTMRGMLTSFFLIPSVPRWEAAANSSTGRCFHATQATHHSCLVVV